MVMMRLVLNVAILILYSGLPRSFSVSFSLNSINVRQTDRHCAGEEVYFIRCNHSVYHLQCSGIYGIYLQPATRPNSDKQPAYSTELY